MVDNLYKIDKAMNIIKEEITRELFECVSKQNNSQYHIQDSPNNLSFSDKNLD